MRERKNINTIFRTALRPYKHGEEQGKERASVGHPEQRFQEDQHHRSDDAIKRSDQQANPTGELTTRGNNQPDQSCSTRSEAHGIEETNSRAYQPTCTCCPLHGQHAYSRGGSVFRSVESPARQAAGHSVSSNDRDSSLCFEFVGDSVMEDDGFLSPDQLVAVANRQHCVAQQPLPGCVQTEGSNRSAYCHGVRPGLNRWNTKRILAGNRCPSGQRYCHR